MNPLPPLVFEDQGTWGHGPGTKEIVIPPGKWLVDKPIVVHRRAGAVIRGAAPYQTELTWAGPADQPMFILAGSPGASIRDLRLRFNTPALAAVVVTNAGASGPYISTKNELKNLDISVYNKCLQYGIVIDGHAYAGNGSNCEHHTVEGCNIEGCVKGGIAVYSSQAHRCKFRSNGVVNCGVGFLLTQASQTVEDNYGGYCGTWFYAGQCFAGPLIFDRNNAEGCRRWGLISPSSGSELYVLRHNRCDGMYPQPITNRADHTQYSSHIAGCVDMTGNNFGSSAGCEPPSFMFSHDVSNMNITGNELALLSPPVINRVHAPLTAQWGAWKNSWQRPDGKREPVEPLAANANTTPQRPAGTPWPHAEPYPDVSAWLAEWRTMTLTAALP